MALPCDLTKAFNDGAFSDVAIRFSGREIKCHKLVLCLASEYFRALCNPGGQFAERAMAVIELHEDDPDALATLLRYLYNFPYPRSPLNGPKFHVSVFMTAKKYLIEELQSIALAGLANCISNIEATYRTSKDIDPIFELYQILSAHKDQHEEFGTMLSELTTNHLGCLFVIAGFREALERDENASKLGEVIRMVQETHSRALGVHGGSGEREFAMCEDDCAAMLAISGPLGFRCPRCNRAATHDQLSRWRRA